MPDDIKTDRRTAILDAAEAQFAHRGYDGVNLRAIAREAGVDVALASYHFGKKEDLFDAVLMRRADVLNHLRLTALTDAMAKASPAAPSVEAIVRAYLGPLLRGPHVSEPGWKHYYALIAYVNNSTEWGGKVMTQFFDPLIRRFIDALRMSLAPVDEKSLFWAYHCFSGALTLTFAQTGRIDQLSKGLCHSEDLDDAYEHVVQFITAGFEALKADRRG